jgi:hypothetical protein
MDPQQFDALSRTLAHSSSRRRAIARVGGAGLIAGLATAFGRGRSEALPVAQDETCRLAIVATVRVGPDATELMQTDVPGELRGEISFALGPDGAIDAGRFLLDGGPEVPVVGQATGRALNLRADLQAVQEGLALVLVGTAEEPLSRCTGAVDGMLTGPLPGDLGDWHATATAAAGATGTTPPTPTPTPVRAAPTPTPTPVRAAPTPTPAPLSAQPCGPGLTRCGDTCVDLGSDLNNCGSCGVYCPAGPGWVCSDGSCVCAPGRALCGEGLGACIDVAFDPANCGSCGITCGAGERCELGTCLPSVIIDNIPLDEAPPDQVSPCLPGLVLCGDGMGVCVDIFVDRFNCGGCGITCPLPQGCQGGVCVGAASTCQDPLVDCGGICVDLGSDPFNCGGCGWVCPPEVPLCVAGSCTP